jgi:hypothetical protein
VDSDTCSILFVHGTGVRRAEFDATLSVIERRLAGIGKFQVTGCYWGDDCGATVATRSIPNDAIDKATEGGKVDNAQVWELLLEDPFIEMRLLASRARTQQSSLSFEADGPTARTRLDTVLSSLPTHSYGLPKGSKACLEESLIAVYDFDNLDAFWEAAEGRTAHPEDATSVLARSITAGWLVRLHSAFQEIPNAADRDSIMSQLQLALGSPGDQKKSALLGAFGELVFAPVAMLASAAATGGLRLGTWAARNHRRTISNSASLRAGDVLLYQSRGEEIRSLIRRSVEAIDRPAVLLGHSLGGIACIDLLLSQDLPLVRRLITVGSQAPFLYEIGALWSLPRDKQPVRGIPPWLNVYDRNDLLSFIASPLFPNLTPPVVDHEVSSGQPFPLSHSAYWSDEGMWNKVAEFTQEPART